MSTLAGRPGRAVVVIDAQRDVLAGTVDRERVIAAIHNLVERARASGVPVVWVQHSAENLTEGSEGWRLVDELSPDDDEQVVHKRYGDAFEDTGLDAVLANHGAGEIIVCGAQTDECVRSTIHGGFTRGYDVTLVEDAHTTEDLTEYGAPAPDQVIAHTNLYWQYHSAPGRVARVVPADRVLLSGS